MYFPFSSSAALLQEQIQKKNFKHCGGDAVELLKKFAPYQGGNELLWSIHQLDIQDKHRALIIGRSSLEGRGELFLPPGVQTATAVLSPEQHRFTFPRDGPLSDLPVIETLERLTDLVDGIIDAFAAMVQARATSASS
ncbi:hypothetical protein [Rhizobacter sp. Root404]|uniref:hypothetical protein n=1 Tax=Rhizobacter sp. Root404 TaxID=1736528 RepID=UPI0006FBC513|nr:hypothetical protein [Rhizobacter sp. Root404]KQW36518.1 hypothetical protein ASC76_17795 [Rhizobacter sp. Root404]